MTAPNEETIGRDSSGDWRSASFSPLAISRDRLKIIELGASPPPKDYLQLTTLLTGLDTVKLSNHCGGVSIKGPVCVLSTAIPVPVIKREGLRFLVYWICSGRLLLTLTDGQDRGAASVSGDSEGSGIMCAHQLLLPFGHRKIYHKVKGAKEQIAYNPRESTLETL